MATRRESVQLILQDDFSTGMAKAAAATALLNRELKSLSGQSVQTSRVTQTISRDVDRVAQSANRADRSINQLTGRLRLFADVAAVLGPTLVPLGGVGIAGIAGFANQLGVAALAGGVLIGSMQGLGDALSAMNKAALEPTAENLAKAEDALNRLSPATARFAREAYDLAPALRAIRDMGAESLFPGLSASLDDLERLAPRVGQLFEAVGGALGSIADDSSASLASERWGGFFDFLTAEAPRTLEDLARSVGSVTHGLAELWQAFAPLNADFSDWLVDVAAGFDEWATGLSSTDGFASFVDYIRETGPQVADTLSALGDALVQLVQAAAPLGGPTLQALEGIATAFAAIVDSPVGTPLLAAASAMALFSRASAGLNMTSLPATFRSLGAAMDTTARSTQRATMSVAAFDAAEKKRIATVRSGLGTLGKSAALMGGLAVASTGAADSIGLTNTTSMALMGTVGGPWGAAIGGGVGLLLDLKEASKDADDGIRGLSDAIATGNVTLITQQLAEAQAEVEKLNAGGWEGFKHRALNPFAGTTEADDIERAKEAIEDLTAAEKGAELAARQSALAFAEKVGLNLDVANTAEMSAEKIKDQAKAFQQLRQDARQAGRDTAASFSALADSINDADVSLSEWLGKQEAAQRALKAFGDNSLKAAREGLDKGLIAHLREAGEEGALRMQQLANGSEAGIKRANQWWRAYQAEVERSERITERLAGLSPVDLRVKSETEQARIALERIRAQAESVAGDYRINYIVTQTNAYNKRRDPNFPSAPGSADGSTVPKTGLPYADRHPYLLADGEEVISNRYGQADRHRWLLKAINANRLADGGTAGGRRGTFEFGEASFGSSAFLDRLAQQQAAAAVEQYRAARRQVRAAEIALQAAQDQDEAADKALQSAQALFDGVASTTRGMFTIDPLATGSSPWARNADPFASLQSVIDRTGAFSAGAQALAGRGLDGAALAYALSNEKYLTQLQAMSDTDLQRFEDLYNAAGAGVESAATMAANLTYGAQVAQATAEAAATQAAVDRMTSEVRALTETMRNSEDRANQSRLNAADRSGRAAGEAVMSGLNKIARWR